MRVRTIVPEANEWVQTVTAIHGRGATAKDWKGEPLRPETQVELPIGTLCLIVNSISTGVTRREWQRLAIVDRAGHWLDIEHSSKTHRDGLAKIAGDLLKLDPGERLEKAVEALYERAQSREYHLQNWIARLESAIDKYPQQFLDALDSRNPTLKLPTAIPGERFVFYVERGAQEKGLALLTDAIVRTRAELETVRNTIRRYEGAKASTGYNEAPH
jgi:hypothetical protein